jgi:hypothetical protein
MWLWVKSDKKNISLTFFCVTLSLFAIARFIAGYSSFSPDPRSSGVWGIWGWNLVSPFYPRGWSALFPKLNQDKGNIETASYLGLGIVFLLVVSIFTYRKRSLNIKFWVRQMFPFICANLTLFLFAVTNRLSIGNWEWEIPFPTYLIELFTIFRASGRMMWPILYSLILLSLIFVARNVKKSKALIILISIIVFQVTDTSSGWRELFREDFKRGSIITKEFSSDWTKLSEKYSELVVNRSSDYEVPGWPLVAFIADRYNFKTNCAPLSRVDISLVRSQSKKFEFDLTSGRLDPDKIYVLNSEREYKWALRSLGFNKNYKVRSIDELRILLPLG